MIMKTPTNATLTGREPGQLLVASLTFFYCREFAQSRRYIITGKARALVSKLKIKFPKENQKTTP